MYLIYFYVPKSHLDPVKNAMFEVGEIKIGNYSNSTWQILGQGQFMPLNCSDALKNTYPYETRAYYVIRL